MLQHIKNCLEEIPMLSQRKLDFLSKVDHILMNQPEDLGFVCRSMVAASMPHSKVANIKYKRSSKKFTLTIIGNEEAGGIPYGIYPRLILSWLSTEVVKNKSREIILGQNLSAFMKTLGLGVTGGRWGTITRFKEQLKRLFSAHITLSYQDSVKGEWISTNINIADRAEIFWNPTVPNQIDIFKSKVILGEIFYEEILKAPIPIDLRALNLLKDSSLALDIYFWLTYRLSYLKKPLVLSFDLLQMQFGGDYANNPQGRYEFKRKFCIQLRKVLALYQKASVKILDEGLYLRPSLSHVRRLNKTSLD